MKSTLSLYMGALLLSIGAMAASIPGEGTFRLPADAPDGLYTHFIDENGIAGYEYHGPVNNTQPSPDLVARGDKQGSYCQGQWIEPGNWDRAIDNFLYACSKENPARFTRAMSVSAGDATAFGCNYGNGQECRYDEIRPFFTALKNTCGNNQQGYYNYPHWKVTYGVAKAGSSFC